MALANASRHVFFAQKSVIEEVISLLCIMLRNKCLHLQLLTMNKLNSKKHGIVCKNGITSKKYILRRALMKRIV